MRLSCFYKASPMSCRDRCPQGTACHCQGQVDSLSLSSRSTRLLQHKVEMEGCKGQPAGKLEQQWSLWKVKKTAPRASRNASTKGKPPPGQGHPWCQDRKVRATPHP